MMTGGGEAQQLSCLRVAAKALLKATHLLVAAGAGFSADSGLPCYDAIASIQAYQEQDISYSDLCMPSMLEAKPRLAYGFWGSCFNLYQDTTPHEGYAIVKKWCDSKDSWHVYTSNVDGHFLKSGFPAESVCEFHGRIDEWMPADLSIDDQDGSHESANSEDLVRSAVQKRITTLPRQHRFKVDEETKLLAEHPDEDSSAGVPFDAETKRPLRPAILMFEDRYEPLLKHLSFAQDRYQRWEATVEEDLRTQAAARFVILELGCGSRVPAVRMETSWVVRDALAKAAECDSAQPSISPEDARVLRIRISLDSAESDAGAEHTLHIQSRALAALRTIDAIMQELRS
mmetsp:Transcript_51010/g.120813  ORF Transcript_51010/g.120813 Transcript_51010/m.120813 type:complete len:344 (+) Transcript_51010:98-1129(+)